MVSIIDGILKGLTTNAENTLGTADHCVQQFIVSVLGFNIHLFNFPCRHASVVLHCARSPFLFLKSMW